MNVYNKQKKNKFILSKKLYYEYDSSKALSCQVKLSLLHL